MISKETFIESVGKIAQENMKKSGILASLVVAQAILESGYGKASIDNNLFGIKATSTWKGTKKLVTTREYVNHQWITIQTYFRTYRSYEGSIHDHTELLLKSRYKRLVGEKDYKKACHIIKECGYATDPNYPKLLIKLIEQNNLTRFDKVEEVPLSLIREIKRKALAGQKLVDPTPEKIAIYKKYAPYPKG